MPLQLELIQPLQVKNLNIIILFLKNYWRFDIKRAKKNNWEKILSDSVGFGEIAKKFGIELSNLSKVCEKYPFRINRYFFSLIKEPYDPIWIQSIPDKNELLDKKGCSDPFFEDSSLSPVNGLVHRYRDRVILLACDKCAMYCRHCMRKRRVGLKRNDFFDFFDSVLDYIKENDEIEDIIISGGDPLLLPDEKIEFLLSSLRNLKKDRIIRIHTRVLSTLPQRITKDLSLILKKYGPIYVNTHFNSVMEITKEAEMAALKLSDSGIPLGCQTVFLKGVNDNYQSLSSLFKELLKIKIKPYYLHYPDPVIGISHLKPDLDKGISILKRMRGRISGMAIPQYMIDLPKGGGKIPLIPEYIKKREKDHIVVENYQGEIYKYFI